MKKFILNRSEILFFSKKLKQHLLFVSFFVTFATSYSQVTTNSGSGLAGTYPSLAEAITALNSATISSPITITLTGNEIAPAGGYEIRVQGTVSNTIVIQGVSSTITASNVQVAGTVTDAIFKLIGADFVTIQNFSMQENALNITTVAATNNMTEFGVALFYGSTINGSQNNTIQNNIISLNRTYLNTFGIYSNTTHSSTNVGTTAQIVSTLGINSYNKIYSNSISNVNYGVVFIGSGVTIELMDDKNEIGTASKGNIITDWGGGNAVSTFISLTTVNCGIFAYNQINDTISHNTITSAALAQPTNVAGISKGYAVSPLGKTIVSNINSNIIILTNNPTVATTVQIIGINNSGINPLPPASTVNISNNTIQNCVLGGTTSTTNGLTCIINQSAAGVVNINNNLLLNNVITATNSTTGLITGISNQAAVGTLTINNNILRNFSSSSTAGTIAGIINTNTVNTFLNINNNQLGNVSGGFFTSTVATTGELFGISSAGALAVNATLSIDRNDIRGIVHNARSTAAHNYISVTDFVAAGVVTTVQNNTFTNLNVNTTGAIALIRQNYAATSTGIKNVNNNSIITAFARPATATSGQLVCVQDSGSSAAGSISNCMNNNFSNISIFGTATFFGFGFADGIASPTKTITGNIFNNINAGSGAMTFMDFSSLSGVSSVSSNTIANITGTGAIIGILLGNSGNTATSVLVAGNNINNITSSGGIIGINNNNTSAGIRIFSNTINSLSSSARIINGIQIFNSNSTSGINISQNTIFNLSNTSSSNTSTVYGISLSSFNTGLGTVIQRNSIYDLNIASDEASSSATGIIIGGGTNVFTNNSIRIGSGIINAIRVDGILELGGINSFLYNSVFINGNPTLRSESSSAITITNTNSTRSIRNNIFFNARSNSGATGKNHAIKVTGIALLDPATLTLNNNVYFANGTGAVFGFYANADVANIAAWRTVTGKDAASISNNPLYTSVTDLSLQATSPALNIAANLSISNDFNGSSRPGANTTFDIGAFERDGGAIATIDIAATAFLNPSSGGIRFQNASFIPQATFSNLGTLNQNSVTVRYRIINSSSIEVYNQTSEVPVMINSLSNTVTFPAAILTATGVYTIFAVAEMAGDLLASNNQASGTLNVQGPLSGTITVGTGGNYTSLTNASGVFDEINQRGVNGNVVVNIISNLTTESGTFAFNEFTTPWTVLIKPNEANITVSGSRAGALIRLDGADRTTIEGSFNNTSSRDLTISNTNTIAPTGIAINSLGLGAGATNNTIRNCNIITAFISSNASTYGIAVGGNVLGVAGADNDNTTIHNNGIFTASIGIYAMGTEAISEGGLDNLRITNNRTDTANTAPTTFGLKLGNALNSIVSGNRISLSSNTDGATPVGISLETGFTSSIVSNNTITRVNNNSFSAGRGITIGTGSTSSNLNVFNNVIYGVIGASFSSIENSPMGIGIGFIGNSSISTTIAGNINLFNNSINMAGDYAINTKCFTSALFVGSFASSLDIRNNIFVNSLNNTNTFNPARGPASQNFAIYSLATNAAFLNLNYNDYFVSGAQGVLGFIGSDRTNLAGIVTGFGQNVASINENPVFTSATNLLPTACAIDNKGKILQNVTLDINGTTRSTSTPDIGAFEINGVALGCSGSIENIWNGSAWSLGTPIATQKLVFEGNYAENADLTGVSYEIRNNAVASIPSDFDVLASGPIVVSSGTLTFKNNSNLIQTGLIENTGNVSFERSTAVQRLAYTYWGSPVSGQSLFAFSPLTLPNRFLTYGEPTNAFIIAASSTNNFANARGYAIRAPNTFADAPAAATTFVGTFTGIPNNGNYSFAATKVAGGYNLIGNPYPSTILASAFFSANPNVTALYFWNNTVLNAPSGHNFATKTVLTAVRATADINSLKVPTDFIGVGQGFFVEASATTTVNFTNAMRSTENNPMFFRNANTNKSLFKLNLMSSTNTFNQIAIGYMQEASSGVDGQIDAAPFAQSTTMVSSLINNKDYVIQGRATPFTNTDVVALGFKTDVAGSYSFTTEAFEGVFNNNQDIFLKDNLTNTTHNIKQSPYNFVSAAGTFNSRFQIVYQSTLSTENPTFNENTVIVFQKDGAIHINSGSMTMKNVAIYDLQGRKITDKNNINGSSTEFNLNIAQQVLLVKITSQDGQIVTKKIIY